MTRVCWPRTTGTLSAKPPPAKTHHEDGNSFAGPSYYGSLKHADRNLTAGTYYTDLSPGFNAILGYIPRTDLREWDNSFGYQWHREGSVVNSFGPGIFQTIDWNHRGELEDWAIKPNFSMTLSRLTYAQFTHSETYELYQNIGFRKHRNDIFLESEPLRWLGLSLDYNFGLSVNYYPPDGCPFLGKVLQCLCLVHAAANSKNQDIRILYLRKAGNA